MDKNNKFTGKTHLIFDFDETIVKLLLPWGNAFDKIGKELNKMDEKIYQGFKKKQISTGPLRNAYVLRFGNKIKKLILKAQSEFELNYLKGYEKNAFIINFIINNTEHEMYIWSSNSEQVIKKILLELKILNKFKAIISSGDVSLLKPYPDGFEKIYNKNIPKENYLLIGDSKFDREGAKNAGIDFYLVDHFNTPGKFW
jgi:HAD superfamily hydrolase (TIGR01549 family)